MKYEWDENKRAANLLKHGVDFCEIENFEWGSALIRTDLRSDYHEQRNTAIGYIGDRIFLTVFTVRGEAIRLIGLRKANKGEQRIYENET